jgi:hypothetical protein
MEELRLYTDGSNQSPWCNYSKRSMATQLHDKQLYHRWGQRKLLMSEIQFLTNYKVKIVIYAGSACGIHIIYLAAALFPNIVFYLIDPSLFDRGLTKLPNVILQSTFFTDSCIEIILKLCKERGINPSLDIGFISDIRSDTAVPEKKNSGAQQHVEDGVLADMHMQANWVKLLKPKYAMLKFRLPYIVGMSELVETQNYVEYLDGLIWTQIYSPEQSSESRLVVTYDPAIDGYPTKIYDCKLYENQLYYFNRYSRVRRTEIPDKLFKQIKKFNSNSIMLKRAEIAIECQIWKEYLLSKNIEPSDDNIAQLINDTTYSLFESYLTANTK